MPSLVARGSGSDSVTLNYTTTLNGSGGMNIVLTNLVFAGSGTSRVAYVSIAHGKSTDASDSFTSSRTSSGTNTLNKTYVAKQENDASTVTVKLYAEIASGTAIYQIPEVSASISIPSLPYPGRVHAGRFADSARTQADPMGSYIGVLVDWSVGNSLQGRTLLVRKTPAGPFSQVNLSGTYGETELTLVNAVPGEDYPFEVTLTDSNGGVRKREWGSSSAYTGPVITSVQSDRVDSSGDLADEGDCAKVAVGWKVYYAGSQTAPTRLSVTVNGVTQNKTSSWGGTVSGSTISGTATFLFTNVNLDTDSAYTVQVVLVDQVKTVTKNDTIGTAFFTMDVLKYGHGVSFGGPAKSEGFFVHMRSFFQNLVRIVKPTSSPPTHAIEVSDGTNDTFTVGWDGNLDGKIKPSSANLPNVTATSDVFPIVLNNSFANGGQFGYTTVAQFWSLLLATSRTANTVLAAPNGSAGSPSFRVLAAADIPNLAASKITSGTLPIARGGTGIATSTTPNRVFATASSGTTATAPSWRALVAADIPNLAASKITSGTLAVARGGTGKDGTGLTFLGGKSLWSGTMTATTSNALSESIADYTWLYIRYDDSTRFYGKWVYIGSSTSIRIGLDRSAGNASAFYIASTDITIDAQKVTFNSGFQLTVNSGGVGGITSGTQLRIRNIWGFK